MNNSALYPLKAYGLPFFHAKFQCSSSNGLATTPIWMKKVAGQVWANFKLENNGMLYKFFFNYQKDLKIAKKIMFQQISLINLIIFIQFV